MTSRWLVIGLLVVASSVARADGEWTDKDYVAAGVPALDHRWNNAELVKAVETITSNTGHLPHYKGAGHATFARIIEAKLEDRKTSVNERFAWHLERLKALDDLAKLYVPNSVVDSREMAELLGGVIVEAQGLQALTKAVVASFGPNDPQHEARMQGIATMRNGWTSMFVGTLQFASDTRVSEADRRLLVSYVERALPTVMHELDAADTKQVRDQLETTMTTVATGPLHADLVALQKSIR
jgi:hypothetical protein